MRLRRRGAATGLAPPLLLLLLLPRCGAASPQSPAGTAATCPGGLGCSAGSAGTEPPRTPSPPKRGAPPRPREVRLREARRVLRDVPVECPLRAAGQSPPPLAAGVDYRLSPLWKQPHTGRPPHDAAGRDWPTDAGIPPPSLPCPDEKLEWLGDRPRAFLWRGFATPDEADNVRDACLGELEGRPASLGGEPWAHRHHMRREQWDIPVGSFPIIDRWTRLLMATFGLGDESYDRPFVTVTRSPPGPVAVHQHYDYYESSALLYLSDGGEEGGGWTTFPLHDKWGVLQKGEGYKGAPQCNVGLQVAPRRGSLLGFWNFHPNGTHDSSSMHGSCKTKNGVEKWVVIWFFNPRESVPKNIQIAT